MLQYKRKTSLRMGHWREYDAYAEVVLRKSSLFAAILDSPPLKRLRRIGFLGAIGTIGESNEASESVYLSRYNHSVGVAYLAISACKALNLPSFETDLIVAAALTHDVGHGALSHSIEPYFKKRYGICHKHVGSRIIRGDLFWGGELSAILQDFNLSPEDILSLVGGKSSLEGAYLFSNPINLDTIDGIMRAASFFSREISCITTTDILNVTVSPSELTVTYGDYFWKLKNVVYNDYIYHPKWAAIDERITIALERFSCSVGAEDFLLTDEVFAHRFGPALARAAQIQERLEMYKRESMNRELGECASRRQFFVDADSQLFGRESLAKRYRMEARGAPYGKPR